MLALCSSVSLCMVFFMTLRCFLIYSLCCFCFSASFLSMYSFSPVTSSLLKSFITWSTTNCSLSIFYVLLVYDLSLWSLLESEFISTSFFFFSFSYFTSLMGCRLVIDVWAVSLELYGFKLLVFVKMWRESTIVSSVKGLETPPNLL